MQTSHCSSCNRHWKQAQLKRSKSRSASTKKDHRKEDRKNTNSKEVEGQESNTGKDEDVVFTTKLPWVVNSPQTRVTTVETNAAESKEEAAEVDPQMPSTPSVEEPDAGQVLQHLRALKKAWGSLPQDLEIKLQACEEKVKDRALTHGHLNRLGKISKQLKGLAAKLTTMDENWQTFSKKVQQKYELHRSMYHQSRQELVKAYMEKAQELQETKEEIQLASTNLTQQFSLTQPPVGDPVEEAGHVILEAMQQDAQLSLEQMESMYPTPPEDEEMSEVQEIFAEAQEAPAEARAQGKKDALKPFSRAVTASPTKVANLHLKQKDGEKEKAKTKTTA